MSAPSVIAAIFGVLACPKATGSNNTDICCRSASTKHTVSIVHSTGTGLVADLWPQLYSLSSAMPCRHNRSRPYTLKVSACTAYSSSLLLAPLLRTLLFGQLQSWWTSWKCLKRSTLLKITSRVCMEGMAVVSNLISPVHCYWSRCRAWQHRSGQ